MKGGGKKGFDLVCYVLLLCSFDSISSLKNYFKHILSSLSSEVRVENSALCGDLSLDTGHLSLFCQSSSLVAFLLARPGDELVGHVGLEVGGDDSEATGVSGDFVPVALHVGEIAREIVERALEHDAV
jgi:hypothetical protein